MISKVDEHGPLSVSKEEDGPRVGFALHAYTRNIAYMEWDGDSVKLYVWDKDGEDPILTMTFSIDTRVDVN